MEEDLKGADLTSDFGGLGWRSGEVDKLVDDEVLREGFARTSYPSVKS